MERAVVNMLPCCHAGFAQVAGVMQEISQRFSCAIVRPKQLFINYNTISLCRFCSWVASECGEVSYMTQTLLGEPQHAPPNDQWCCWPSPGNDTLLPEHIIKSTICRKLSGMASVPLTCEDRQSSQQLLAFVSTERTGFNDFDIASEDWHLCVLAATSRVYVCFALACQPSLTSPGSRDQQRHPQSHIRLVDQQCPWLASNVW